MWKHAGVLFVRFVRRLPRQTGVPGMVPERSGCSLVGFSMSTRRYRYNAETDHHRGSTLSGVLVAVSLVTVLSVTAVVVTPRYLTAQSIASDVVAARNPLNQQFINGLGALIGRSVEVLAVRPRGATPYSELVLWLEDGGRPGRLDPPELAVLSHSEVLQTIVLYQRFEGESEASSVLDRAAAQSAGFCDRWRSDSLVAPTVLATGVADMRIEQTGRPYEATQRLRITLTWSSDSSDGPDEASVLVDAAMCNDAQQE